MANTLIVHIEIDGDGELDRAKLESLLSVAAYQVARGGVCRRIEDTSGKRYGYWAITPEKLKIDFFNKHVKE